MRVVGLTGGIGSGKTTVANFFRNLGVPIYIADLEAKKIMQTSPEVQKQIIKSFGEQSYTANIPDRRFLASVVFKDEEKLNILNSIIHPAVAINFEEWKNEQDYSYVIYEAAILFEKGSYKKCDLTILITAPEDIRLQRVIKRDHASLKEIRARMDQQWSDERKNELASFVIENINLPKVKKEVGKIHQYLLSLD